MDEPSRSPYRLDLDNGPVNESDRILRQSGIPPSTFLFLRGRAPIRESEVSAPSSDLDDLRVDDLRVTGC